MSAALSQLAHLMSHQQEVYSAMHRLVLGISQQLEATSSTHKCKIAALQEQVKVQAAALAALQSQSAPSRLEEKPTETSQSSNGI